MTSKILTFFVSLKWFEHTVYTNVRCPNCDQQTQVLVSTSSTQSCDHCKETFTVEFVVEES